MENKEKELEERIEALEKTLEFLKKELRVLRLYSITDFNHKQTLDAAIDAALEAGYNKTKYNGKEFY
jgi:hypothetical protein